jgi:tetratricopeptide (TPR) repeat protein
MRFGPAEMAQMMDGAKALITVMLVSSVGIGIVLGAIVALFGGRGARRGKAVQDQFGVATVLLNDQSKNVPKLDQKGNEVEEKIRKIDELEAQVVSLAHYARPTATKLFSVALVITISIAIAIAGAGFFWYYTSKGSDFEATNQRGIQPLPSTIERQQQMRSDFEATYNQFGIQPLPSNVERQQQVQSRLAQLSREACYTDAIDGLGQALLDAGYPREAANSLRTFVKRCGSAPEVLPLAYSALEKLNDFSAALEVANELVEALPASGTFRYWRALAYDRTGNFSLAMLDYMNTVQLFEPQKTIVGDVFYKWSRTYAALGRYCDAISPIEMYVSLDPANRRTPQITKIISDYAEQGGCDKRYATGTTRVSFAGSPNVRTLTVVVNGVAGNLILDTGATFVSITSQFAFKAKVATEPRNQVIMKTVGGKALAEIGYANSVSVGEGSGIGRGHCGTSRR